MTNFPCVLTGVIILILGGALGSTLDVVYVQRSRNCTGGHWSLISENHVVHVDEHQYLSATLKANYDADSFAPFQFEMDRMIRWLFDHWNNGEIEFPGWSSHPLYYFMHCIGVTTIHHVQNPLVRYTMELLNSLPKGSGVKDDLHADFDEELVKHLDEKLQAHERILSILMMPRHALQETRDTIGRHSSMLSALPYDIRKLFFELGEKAFAAYAIHAHMQKLHDSDSSAKNYFAVDNLNGERYRMCRAIIENTGNVPHSIHILAVILMQTTHFKCYLLNDYISSDIRKGNSRLILS